MIKKVLCLTLVIIFTVPCFALANDAFHYDYNGKDLQITIKRLQSDFSIGEDYSFNVSITNTSKWEINLISLESSLFEGGGVYISNIAPDTVRRLNPGEKFTLTCTIEVPYNISWYKKNNEFYYDLTISVGYLIIYSDDEDDYVYAMSVDQPITIMINNLNDGSDFLAMEYTSEDSSGIFEKRWDNANYEEYGYYYDNTITATNTSDFNLEKLLIHGLCVEPLYIYKAPILVDEVNCSVLAPDDKKDETILGRYSVILENLPDSITDRHQAIFMVDENYYAVGLEKEIDMQIAVYPYLDCTINEIDGKSQVTFENNTGFDFENFYFGEPFDLSSEIAVIDESSLMPVFANGKKAEFTVKKYQGYDYFIGYTLGGYFFKWDAQLYISDTGKSYFHIGEHNQYDYIFLSDVTPSPSPSPTPKLTPSPTPTNTPIPTATSTPKPTPSPTAQATSIPTDSPTVSPAIEITDVKKSSSIPFWVWYVLAVAVIAGAVLTVTLRRKNKDKFE